MENSEVKSSNDTSRASVKFSEHTVLKANARAYLSCPKPRISEAIRAERQALSLKQIK